MATVRIFPLQSRDYYSFGEFNGVTVTSSSGNRVRYVEDDGDYLIIKGKNLRVEGDEIVGGTLTGMTHYSVDGVKYAELTGGHLAANDIPYSDTPWAAAASILM